MIHRFYGDICALFAALYSLHPYRSARRAIPLSTNIGWTWNAGPSVIWQACAAESKSFIYSSGRFHLCQIQLFCLRSSTNYIWMYLIMGSHDFFNIIRPYYALCPDLNSRINIYTHPHPCLLQVITNWKLDTCMVQSRISYDHPSVKSDTVMYNWDWWIIHIVDHNVIDLRSPVLFVVLLWLTKTRCPKFTVIGLWYLITYLSVSKSH